MVPLKRASSCSRHFAQSRRQLGEQSAHFSALLEHFFPPICPRLPNFVPPESYTLVFSAYIRILSPYSLLLTELCLESVLLTLNMSYDAASSLCSLYPLKVSGQDASHENGYFLKDALNKCFLTPTLPHTFSVTMATRRTGYMAQFTFLHVRRFLLHNSKVITCDWSITRLLLLLCKYLNTNIMSSNFIPSKFRRKASNISIFTS